MIAVLADCCCETLVYYKTTSPYTSLSFDIFSELEGGVYVLKLYVRFRIDTIATSGSRWIESGVLSDYTFLTSGSDTEEEFNLLEAYALAYAYNFLHSYSPPSVIYSTFLGVSYKSIYEGVALYTSNTVQSVYKTYKII